LDTEIRVLDKDDRDLPCGVAGAIVIRGPTVFPGYLEDAEANAAAFLPGGWFRTGDLGHMDEDGMVYLHGRLNELINRGGEKISQVEVDHALLSHPAVADAAVFAVPGAPLGEDLVAAVVLKPGMHVEGKSLHRRLLDRVALFKVPRLLG
jgi:oxalate---CoA ligase